MSHWSHVLSAPVKYEDAERDTVTILDVAGYPMTFTRMALAQNRG